MSIKGAMLDLINIYKNAAINKPTADKLKEQVTALSNRTECGGRLAREKFAYSTLHDVLWNQFYIDNLALAYEYQGKLYSTHKDAPKDQSTNVLHDLQLSTDEWHQLKRFTVYHDFTIYDAGYIL